jgi:hypothetical protein
MMRRVLFACLFTFGRDFMKKLFLILTCACLFFCMALPAAAETDQALGELLANNFFSLIAAKDWKVLEKHVAPCFQSVHSDGARSRAQEMALLKKLDLGEYKLADFKTTRKGDVLVVTYTVAVSETIGGKRTNKTPAPRLSVFSHTKATWQIMAHANLKPLAK